MPAKLPIDAASPWLAPLSGYTDLPFRLLCRELGASVCCTEMISAKGLIYNSPGTKYLLRTCEADKPLILQLFCAEEQPVALAMEKLLAQGFEWFDLNAGCPAPKVTRSGCGAAMLKDPENLIRVVRTMVARAGTGKVGVKLRLGWDKPIIDTLLRPLEDCGVGWLTLHPRLGRQKFTGTADWPALKAVQKKISIPLIASGDLLDAASAVRCLETSEAAGVMFARGALSNPAVFGEYRSLLPRGETNHHGADAGRTHGAKQEIGQIIRRHIALAQEFGQAQSLVAMRSFIPRYVKKINMARTVRQEIIEQDSWSGLRAVVDKYWPEH